MSSAWASSWPACARPCAGALLLGLAAACRPTYALAFIPFALAVLDSNLSWASIRAKAPSLAAAAVVSSLTRPVFYAPLLLHYGLSWRTFVDHPLILASIVVVSTTSLFGFIGAPAVLTALALSIAKVRRRPPPRHQWAVLAPLGAATVIYAALFLRLPDEPFYLLPGLVGVYAFLCAYASRRRVIYAVRVDGSGGLADTPDGDRFAAGQTLPKNSRFVVIDAVARLQAVQALAPEQFGAGVLDTSAACGA